uniref:Galectin n=1 Tax=Podarcis muralis TaxID=64176 RepID=A0A670IT84_PODMU
MSSKSLVVVVLFDIWWEGVPQGGCHYQEVRLPFSHFRFAVNFLCANGDIAFHFNPRFDMLKPVVVCNTDEVFWGEEEIASSMPFKQNNSFEMTVNLESGCYQVYVNGNHFLEYKHRVPLKEIQTLEVKGDVSVNLSGHPFLIQPQTTPFSHYPSAINPPHPTFPFSTISSCAASVSISHFRFAFTVNLLGKNGDIVFHFNPRMNENEVVCNTKQNGGWGKEERWPIPFEAGATFMMIIDVMSDCYRVRLPAGAYPFFIKQSSHGLWAFNSRGSRWLYFFCNGQDGFMFSKVKW